MPQPWLGRVVAEANDLQDEFVFEVTSLPRYLAGRNTDRADAGARRASLGLPGQHAHGRHLEPRRREAAGCPRRARARTSGRAAGGAVRGAGAVPGPAAGPGLARDGAQLGSRLHLRLLGRRRGRRRAAPLRRGAGHRGRAGRPGGEDVHALPGAAGPHGAQPVAARARAGVVELVVPADGPAPANVQVLSERSGLPGSMVLDADTVRTVLGMLQGPRISDDAWVHEIRIDDTEDGIDVTVSVGTEEKPGVRHRGGEAGRLHPPGGEARRRGASRHGPARRETHRRPTVEVPGYGWRRLRARPLAHPVELTESGGDDLCPAQRSGGGGGRPVQRDLRPERRRRLRPAGGRR